MDFQEIWKNEKIAYGMKEIIIYTNIFIYFLKL